MRILISGAGIAGLTLAHWLHKFGHEAIIVEKSPNIRTTGYMIDFTGTGWDVADRMGLIPAIRKHAFPTEAVTYKNEKDEITAQISMKKLMASMGANNNFAALNRRDLVLMLYEMVKDYTEIRFASTIESITQSRECVSATYNDGTQDSFDLLIACDGIHSNVRRLTFGEESLFSHYLGYQFAIFTIPAGEQDLGHSYHVHVKPNLQLGIMPINSEEWLIFVAYQHDSATIPIPENRLAFLQEKLAGIAWLAPELLAKLTPETDIFMDTISQIQMPRWFNNRVGLIGDAAYCPTLISGQGASMAMAGAYFLAEELSQSEDYQVAFQNLDSRLRPHIEKVQQRARNFAPTFIPKSRLRIQMLNWVLRFADLPMFRQIVGKQITTESILESA